MNMSNRAKAIVITVILGSGILVACGTSSKAPGGSASIALAQAHATATAEVAQTATAMIAEANRRNDEALARMTAIASAGMQSTLTVQEQQINDLAISQAKANATQQAQLFRATATAVSVQKTAQADMYTATAVSVRQVQNDAETNSRFWSYLGFVVILLLVFGIGGGLLLVGWRFVVRHSFIPNPNGAGGVVVEFSPFDLLKPRAARTPSYQLLLPAGSSTPSAAPDNEPETMRVTSSGKMAMPVEKLAVSEKSRTQVEWEQWVEERGKALIDMAWVTCRETGHPDSDQIPHWEEIREYFPVMSGRWWQDVTDVLAEVGALSKAPGKKNKIVIKDRPSMADLNMLSGQGKLFPLSPAKVWLGKRKNAGNGTGRRGTVGTVGTDSVYQRRDG
jgi:hypothetical protein